MSITMQEDIDITVSDLTVANIRDVVVGLFSEHLIPSILAVIGLSIAVYIIVAFCMPWFRRSRESFDDWWNSKGYKQ